jgi:hypothetical protein
MGAGVTLIPTEYNSKTHPVIIKGMMQMQMHMEDYFTDLASV